MKSSIIASVLVFAISLADAFPGYSTKNHPRPNKYAPRKLTLLHTNDIHTHFNEFNSGGVDCTAKNRADNKCYGGVARIKSVVDSYRNRSSNVVLFDAGDQFQGTLYFNTYGGAASSEFMNALKYDAMALGNHEFDLGLTALSDFVKSLNFPVLSSNIDFKTAPILKKAGVKPYIVLHKYSLGIIGFITNTTSDITLGGKNITFYNPSGPVQQYVKELRSYGIKRIICVSHNGYNEDMYLASNTYGVDLIVGGHSHSLLLKNTSLPQVQGPYPTSVTNKEGKTTWIVQAHRYGDYLGHLELEWDKHDNMLPPRGDPILLDQNVTQHTATQNRVVELSQAFANLTQKIVGFATDDFPVGPCFNGECAIGDLLADCMLEPELVNGAQIAMTNTGGIRASFQKGNISYADVVTMLPFGNVVVSFSYTGAQLKALFENAAAMHNQLTNKPVLTVPQWAGIQFAFDATLPEGQKVTSATVGGKPLDLTATYKILTNDFVAGGGDNIMPAVKFTPGNVMADVFAACLSRRGPLVPTTNNRFPKLR
ncbi:hypothetical protein BASA83_001170 [Batrachochytrium salamandrivorans]|nr:hypothetical protein BASA83_001170 [Batrachochytrium salamandrivorans]